MDLTAITQATRDAWGRVLTAARADNRANPDPADVERPLGALFANAVAAVTDDRQRGVQVVCHAGRELDAMVRNRGGWPNVLGNLDRESRNGLQGTGLRWLPRGDLARFDEQCVSDSHRDVNGLRRTLMVAAGLMAALDPDGSGQTALARPARTAEWEPSWQKFPEWRRKLIAGYRDPAMHTRIAELLEDEAFTFYPDTTSLEGARILAAEEADRLERARLFLANRATTALAMRKAMRPRTAPLVAHRVPRPYGLVVFEAPLTVDANNTETAYVAASWGRWTPGTQEHGWKRMRTGQLLPDTGRELWWISLYRQEATRSVPLWWCGEDVAFAGQTYPEGAEPGTIRHVVRTVIACWDLHTQYRVGKAVTDVTEYERKPAKARADRRRGIVDDGTVSLISPRRRPSAPRPRDGDIPTGYKLDYQQPVSEYDKNHCRNPRLHAEGGCTHEDITVLDYIRGPADAPLRMPQAVVERVRGTGA
jgi:hypothetical protein